MSVSARPLPLLLLLAVTACETDPTSYDRDEDGVANFEDCEPDDGEVYPGAEEVCDGKDNNCNGQTDEGITSTWYLDRDQDGFGDPESAEETCAPAANAVENADDCDDNSAATYPGAIEICDAADNDCDEEIDEARWIEDFQDDLVAEITDLDPEARVIDDVDDERVLRLTRASPSVKGAVWYVPRVPAEAFRLTFRQRMSAVGDNQGEGLAIAILKGSPEEIDAGAGPGMGLYGSPVDGWAIELDPYKNDADDTSLITRHVAVHDIRTGDRITEVTTTPPFFNSGGWQTIEVLMEGPVLTMKIGSTTVFDGEILPINLGDDVSIGISASTSATHTLQISVDDIELGCPLLPEDTGDTDGM